MKSHSLNCQSEQRRHKMRRQNFNGLDYLEVGDDQRTLKVFFIGPAPAKGALSKANVRIRGGRRIRDIQVTNLKMCPQIDPEIDNCMIVTVDKPGDFSTYCLCLVDVPERLRFDPRYLCLDFSFKVGCPSDLDCQPAQVCPPEERREPEINYLAKDYASFRRLILDRLAVVMPDWRERHIPDLGITLVELLAYAGDYLSYYQDAVATEAYLGTARQRISVRRHALLMDYLMHEGCNARTWVHVHVEAEGKDPLDLRHVSFLTSLDELSQISVPTWDDLKGIPQSRYEAFEPVLEKDGMGGDVKYEVRFLKAHNEIHFHTWGDRQCCLEKGAVSATLIAGPARPDPTGEGEGDDYPEGDGEVRQEARQKGRIEEDGNQYTVDLKKGDVLIFEEVIGPETGNPADADPSRRHAVRLTKVEKSVDELCRQPVLEITWSQEDALPFSLCISAVGPQPECKLLTNVSVARGNVILVDHGRKTPPEDLGCVPLGEWEAECCGEGLPSDPVFGPGRYRPRLQGRPLTFRQPPDPEGPASGMLTQDPRLAEPCLWLSSRPDPECRQDWPDWAKPPRPEAEEGQGSEEAPEQESQSPPQADAQEVPAQQWKARHNLLASGPEEAHVVAEIDDRGLAHLRFGDGELGRQPQAGHRFQARYRVGNGPAGNVGAEAISHILRDKPSGGDFRPRNPLPAQGGTSAETLEQVKLFAPQDHKRQLQRAVIPDDYAALTERDFKDKVQRAAAVLRWTGSWYEVLTGVDAWGGSEAGQALLDEIRGGLYPYRRIGHDLAVEAARQVPLDLAFSVCVKQGFLRGHVKAALSDRFSSRLLADGTRGYFHPDNLTFGQGIFLSKLVAAAQAVTGVESVKVTRLERLFEGPAGEIEDGLLPLSPLEVARLDNDPDFPENGKLQLELRGGR